MSNVVRFVGIADGPKVFVAELGTKVRTFTEEPGGKFPALRHHVPPVCRGPFRPEQLANYDSKKQYRTDATGYVLCYEKLKDGQTKCRRKAVNRHPKCNFHGGRVHPLDKLVRDDVEMAEPDPESMTRYQLYLAKQISVDDLDDEEIMNFGFRNNQGRIFKPKNITRDMIQAFTKAIYERSLDSLKANALEAVKTLTTIMMDDQVDAPVRIKAATEVLDRTLGKAPQTVQLIGNAPWEQVFEGLASVSREESRAIRGQVIDAEVVGDDVSQEHNEPPKRNLLKELENMGRSESPETEGDAVH